jgi:cell shape-determining protein MreC
MTAKDYSTSTYPGYPTYQKIAHDAFLVGQASTPDGSELEKLKRENALLKSKLRELNEMLNDPVLLADWF